MWKLRLPAAVLVTVPVSVPVTSTVCVLGDAVDWSVRLTRYA